MTGTKRRGQVATSLVEVLAVMVILLIGIFAIIRLFPIGFQYMKQAELRSVAVRLAHQQLESVKADSQNLPTSISFSYYDLTAQTRRTVAGYSPDMDLVSVTELARTALDSENPYYRDVNLYRFVEGERVKVPMPTIANGVNGSLYTVRFGPIYMDTTVGTPTGAPTTPAEVAWYNSFLKVTGAPLTGFPAESDNGTDPGAALGLLRTQQNYAIDYGGEGDNAYIFFLAAPQNRTFLISYTYERTTADATETVEDVSLTVPAGFTGWLPIPLPAGGNAQDVLPFSETVKRVFTRIASTTTWDLSDPYQYKLVHPNVPAGPGGPSFANLGMVAFNPAGATYAENGQPFAAYLDYAVLDWHVIRDDREVPSVTPGVAGDVPVRLSLSKIKPSGEDNPDGTIYEGIFPSANPADNFDIVVVRLDDGSVLTRGDFANRTTTESGAGFWINNEGRDSTYQSGTIYLNSNVVPQGTPIRILYKGTGEWAASLSKACAFYKPTVLPSGASAEHPPLTPTDHDADPTTEKLPLGDQAKFGVLTSDPNRAVLTFNLCELNKSAVGIFEYTDGSGNSVRTPAVQFTIGDEVELDTLDDTDATVTAKFAACDVTRFMPGRAPGTPWRVVGNLQGVSVKSRVIWKDEVSRRARWRIQDLDSYLTRSVQ